MQVRRSNTTRWRKTCAYLEDRGTTIELKRSYLLFHSFTDGLYDYLRVSSYGPCAYPADTYFGTATSAVSKYSESSTKSSFETMSTSDRTDKFPLKDPSQILFLKLSWMSNAYCFFLCICSKEPFAIL